MALLNPRNSGFDSLDFFFSLEKFYAAPPSVVYRGLGFRWFIIARVTGPALAWRVESNRIRGDGQVKWMNKRGGFVILTSPYFKKERNFKHHLLEGLFFFQKINFLYIASLKLTAISHLKLDGWKMIHFLLGSGWLRFREGYTFSIIFIYQSPPGWFHF